VTLDLEALRNEVWFYNGLYPPKALALINELAEARREIAERITERTTLLEREANARAAAFEEAARAAETRRSVCCMGSEACPDGDLRCDVPREIAAELRALSATPATVVCVSVETVRTAVVGMTQVRDCIEGGWDPHKGSPLGRAKWADAMRNLRAALAELAKVKP